jgi:hypothetical protein
MDKHNEKMNASKGGGSTSNTSNTYHQFTKSEEKSKSATKSEVVETVAPPVSGTIDSVKPTRLAAPIFHNTNFQSDGTGKRLRRIEFVFNGQSYKFALNPEEYQQEEPNRVTAMQTKGGAYVDDFGGGIPILQMKGTTGFKENGRYNSGGTGFTRFKALRDLIRKYYFDVAPGSIITQDKEMIFHNYTDGEHWVVVPKVFKLMRSVSRPLLYAYDIELILLRPAYVPATKSDTGANLGTLGLVEVNKR